METQCAGALPVRQYRYDNLKFFLIVLVVVGHFVDQYDAKSDVFKGLYVFIYSFHMPLFLFVSGLFTRRYTKQGQFPVEKVLVFIFLGYTLKLCIYLMKRLYGRHPDFEWLSDSSVPWYMFALSAFLILSYVFRKVKLYYILPVWLLFSCCAGYVPWINDFLYLSRIIVFFPFFLVGYHWDVGQMEEFLRCHKRLKFAAVSFTALFFVLCFWERELVYPLRGLFTGRLPYASVDLENCNLFHRLLCYAVSTVMGIAVLAVVPAGRIPVISKLGTRTLQVYFLHKPLFYIFIYNDGEKVLEQCFGNAWKAVLLLIAVAAAFLLSLKCFEAPFKAVLNCKIRGKSRTV